MQSIRVISKSRQALTRVLQNPSPILSNSSLPDQLATHGSSCTCTVCSIPTRRRFHSAAIRSGVVSSGRFETISSNNVASMIGDIRLFSSEAVVGDHAADADSVKGVYDKMLNSVAKIRTAPPNSWLWSLIGKCSTPEDITLLFDILKRLRIFRLSNLRIAEDFNRALSIEVTKACVRAGAIDFGKRALCKNNQIGLTPDIGSANHLLLHAKQHSDVKLMTEIMELVKRNELPLQPGTADIVFSICSSVNRWDLATKYGRRFFRSQVKLRQTSFDTWMEFVVKKGDVDSLWKIEKRRSETMKKHSLATGFSCAKGFLLDHKPESAAAIIQEINQSLPDAKWKSIAVELQKLASEWPLELIKHQKEDNRKAFVTTLRNDIYTMIIVLPSLGVEANVVMEDLSNLVSKEEVSV